MNSKSLWINNTSNDNKIILQFMFNLNPEQECETVARLIANGYCRNNANHKQHQSFTVETLAFLSSLNLDKLRL